MIMLGEEAPMVRNVPFLIRCTLGLYFGSLFPEPICFLLDVLDQAVSSPDELVKAPNE